MYKYAGIIVNNSSLQVDRLFTYLIPESLNAKIEIGSRVKVPFGTGNKNIDGFVFELYEEANESINYKSITQICEETPILSESDLRLIKVMREKYLCSYMECIKSIIPTIVLKGIKEKTTMLLFIGNDPIKKLEKEPYSSIYKVIYENEGKFTKSELAKSYSFSASSIKTMLKYNIIIEKSSDSEMNKNAYDSINEETSNNCIYTLNPEQQNVVNKIIHSEENMFLIRGVTGSGKTEVYMSIVEHMMSNEKQSIVLIPEIALTPQTVQRFKKRFGENIAVFHSRLSDTERYNEWLKVKNSDVKLAIGARSGVFLPFDNLGVIIIDEEHENSYKSDSDPKYNAREIAMIRSNIEKCKVVLGSATPSIESYYAAKKGSIKLLELNKRADGASMPEIRIVDMKNEIKENNNSIFSNELKKSIENCLKNNQQVILFINRRGYSTFVSCRKCGYVFKCSNCDISLTFHAEEDNLTCHYCGNKQRVPASCPSCGSKYVKYFGAGTERVEQEIAKLFPNAKTLRMDYDSTRKKNSYENIYNAFKNKEADILIGTQMVAKGLDFKNVTLVGVISADVTLNLPDYRAAEKTFQLITQVSGRAGRGRLAGKVVIQTYSPENFSIKHASLNDFDGYFENEIIMRKQMLYPPFTKILCINISSKNEEKLKGSALSLGSLLKSSLKSSNVKILGPCPCEITKLKSLFRWQIIIKGDLNKRLTLNIRDLVYNTFKFDHNNIRISLDINPNSLV